MSAVADKDEAPSTPVLVVSCRVCRGIEAVKSRAQFSRFEDRHATDCGLSCVAVNGTYEDVLDLPPY